ncbi:MAG: NifU family protein [Spirochaetota bacterium]|nr:NifU family protein [Spirochaetota bacterium]
MKEKVQEALAKIRTKISNADVALVDVNDGIVKVKLLMSSCGAPMTFDLLHESVEDMLKAEIPEIKEVVSV